MYIILLYNNLIKRIFNGYKYPSLRQGPGEKLQAVSEEPLSAFQILQQRLSVAILKGNAATMLGNQGSNSQMDFRSIINHLAS